MGGPTINLSDFIDLTKFDGDACFCPSSEREMNASGSVSVQRGDPAAVDFAVGDFTTDETWRELDLSSILPANARFALCTIELEDDAAGSVMRFKLFGQTNSINVSEIGTQVVNVPIFADLMIPVDGDRKAAYYGTNTAFNTIDLTVKGWIF